jgi:translation initiation factor 2 beta subunit (eIF-2beta)/eIF-5
MSEYSGHWNKCPSCGYMEEKTVSRNRILSKLCPDRLNEPFVEPVTAKVVEESTQIGIYGKRKKRKNNSKK